MFRNRVAYALVLLSAGMLMYYTGDRVASLLLYSLLLLPVVSLLLLLFALPFLRVEEELDRSCIDKDDEAVIQVSFRNCGPFYLPFIRLDFYQNETAFPTLFRAEPSALAPGAQLQSQAAGACRYAGRFQVGISRIWVSDLCGLFSLPMRRPALILYVCPKVTEVPIPPGLLGMVNRESYNRREQRGEGSEFHSIREYQRGDLLKRVHWGLTAKMGELQVRQLRRTPDPTCTILLDPHLSTGPQSHRIPLNDGMLCGTISLAAAFLEEKIPARLLFWDGAPRSEELCLTLDVRQGQTSLSQADFSDTFTLDDLMSAYWMHLKTCRSVVVVALDNGSQWGGRLFELERLGCGVVVCQVALSGQRPGNTGLLLQKSGIGVCRYIADTGEFLILSDGRGERK